VGRSQAGHPFQVLGVAGAVHLDLRGAGLDLGEVTGGELDVGGADVLLQPSGPAGAGDGTIQGFWASSQASAICAGVAPLRRARVPRKSTSAWFASRFSPVNRGMVVRMSELVNVVLWSMVPVRKPLPSGL
jgi:hypothetical protein